MNTGNFWVIRTAQWPIPVPPSETKIGLMTLNVSFHLVNTETPAGTRKDRGAPYQVQLRLGSGLRAWRGSFSPSVILCLQGRKMLSQVPEVQEKVSQTSHACFSSPVIQIKEALTYTTDLKGSSSCSSISETSFINPRGLSLK